MDSYYYDEQASLYPEEFPLREVLYRISLESNFWYTDQIGETFEKFLLGYPRISARDQDKIVRALLRYEFSNFISSIYAFCQILLLRRDFSYSAMRLLMDKLIPFYIEQGGENLPGAIAMRNSAHIAQGLISKIIDHPNYLKGLARSCKIDSSLPKEWLMELLLPDDVKSVLLPRDDFMAA